ncbi:MAG: hypothetical protein AB7P52_17755 [Alphaproteobacteria bacterium]
MARRRARPKPDMRAGHRRLAPVTSRETHQQAMWRWMRRRRRPWTTPDLAEAASSSPRLARRYVQRLAAAGYLVEQAPDEDGARQRESTGQYRARSWRLARDTGPLAPILAGGAHGRDVTDPNGTMPGAELARARRRLGLTFKAVALIVLGVRDHRAVQRYESLARLPPPIEQRLVRYLERHPA